MFVNEQKIMHQVIDKSHNFEFNDNAITWLFADDLSDDELQNFIRSQNSPHSQIIISGTKSIGEFDSFAKQLKSAWVYYLPFIFMKDGANFGAFFSCRFTYHWRKKRQTASKRVNFCCFAKKCQNLRD